MGGVVGGVAGRSGAKRSEAERSGAERGWGRDLWAGSWDQGLGWCWGRGWAERSEVELGVLSGDGGVVGAGLRTERSEAELGGYWRGVGVVGR